MGESVLHSQVPVRLSLSVGRPVDRPPREARKPKVLPGDGWPSAHYIRLTSELARR